MDEEALHTWFSRTEMEQGRKLPPMLTSTMWMRPMILAVPTPCAMPDHLQKIAKITARRLISSLALSPGAQRRAAMYVVLNKETLLPVS